MRRAALAALVGLLLVLAGCGSSHPAPPTSDTKAVKEILAAARSATPSAATAATPTSAYPIVHWNFGVWPFTVQLASLTERSEGYVGLGSAPPKWTWLMVAVNITNESQGRTPPTPEPELKCSAPNGSEWNPEDAHTTTPMLHGYLLDPASKQLAANSQIGLAYGTPYTYGAEWEVPEGTSTEDVWCNIEEAAGHRLLPLIE